jgi:hypothetical protein
MTDAPVVDETSVTFEPADRRARPADRGQDGSRSVTPLPLGRSNGTEA